MEKYSGSQATPRSLATHFQTPQLRKQQQPRMFPDQLPSGGSSQPSTQRLLTLHTKKCWALGLEVSQIVSNAHNSVTWLITALLFQLTLCDIGARTSNAVSRDLPDVDNDYAVNSARPEDGFHDISTAYSNNAHRALHDIDGRTQNIVSDGDDCPSYDHKIVVQKMNGTKCT